MPGAFPESQYRQKIRANRNTQKLQLTRARSPQSGRLSLPYGRVRARLPPTSRSGHLGSSPRSRRSGNSTRLPARCRHRRGACGRSTLPEPGSGYGGALRRCLPKRAVAGGHSIASSAPSTRYMDQPCCTTERWWHKPGAGRTGRIWTIQ